MKDSFQEMSLNHVRVFQDKPALTLGLAFLVHSLAVLNLILSYFQEWFVSSKNLDHGNAPSFQLRADEGASAFPLTANPTSACNTPVCHLGLVREGLQNPVVELFCLAITRISPKKIK